MEKLDASGSPASMETKEADRNLAWSGGDQSALSGSERIQANVLPASSSASNQAKDSNDYTASDANNNNDATSRSSDGVGSPNQTVAHDEKNDDERKLSESEEMKNGPDPNAIKMFVGQLPREWNEEDCRRLLEPFGPIYHLNLLRDKVTNKSKGKKFRRPIDSLAHAK